MDEEKRKRLEAAGWRIGDAEEFLGLSEAEAKIVREGGGKKPGPMRESGVAPSGSIQSSYESEFLGKRPNAESRQAIRDAQDGVGITRYANADELLDALTEDEQTCPQSNGALERAAVRHEESVATSTTSAAPLLERAKRAAGLSCRERERLLRDMIAAMERMRLSLAILHTWAAVDGGIGLVPEHVLHQCDVGLAAYEGIAPPAPLNPLRKAEKP